MTESLSSASDGKLSGGTKPHTPQHSQVTSGPAVPGVLRHDLTLVKSRVGSVGVSATLPGLFMIRVSSLLSVLSVKDRGCVESKMYTNYRANAAD